MKQIFVCIFILYSILVYSQAKSTKTQRSASKPQQKLKKKQTTHGQTPSKKTKYVDQDEEISCECSCLTLNNPNKQENSKSRKTIANNKKSCTSKKCKGKPSIEGLASVQQPIPSKKTAKIDTKSRNQKKSRVEARSRTEKISRNEKASSSKKAKNGKTNDRQQL